MKKNVPDLAEVYNLLDQDHSQRNINLISNAFTFHIAAETPSASINVAQSTQSHRSNRPMCSHCG